ncbi:uncharacterized protein LOC121785312 [Salvia splendens]|uniref:uncharacterized protein LOC121785312 n=1 Tax=Salvia splendens TaxID=180675 RepID=UPI001C26EA54|nr:uncharacterized protein LOC121785312 [Salvia splendens]
MTPCPHSYSLSSCIPHSYSLSPLFLISNFQSLIWRTLWQRFFSPSRRPFSFLIPEPNRRESVAALTLSSDHCHRRRILSPDEVADREGVAPCLPAKLPIGRRRRLPSTASIPTAAASNSSPPILRRCWWPSSSNRLGCLKSAAAAAAAQSRLFVRRCSVGGRAAPKHHGSPRFVPKPIRTTPKQPRTKRFRLFNSHGMISSSLWLSALKYPIFIRTQDV